MTSNEIIAWATAAIAPIVGSLLIGKTLRRLVLMPFEYLSKRTATKLDDQVIADAAVDLGITPTRFDNDSDTDKEDK